MNNLDNYILELLHINDYNTNNLIDINCRKDNSITITSNYEATYTHILRIIKDRIGLIANTVLKDSSMTESEQMIGKDLNIFNWSFLNSNKNATYLNNFISDAYKNILTKGSNPLFLSIGALRWKINVNNELIEVESPLIIFPVRLVRSGPVYIEFIDDDIYFNPCLYFRLLKEIPDSVVLNLPGPNNEPFNYLKPIDLNLITNEYFDILEKYINENRNTEDTVFEIIKDRVYISTYDHEDICMYYDLRRNYDTMINHNIIRSMYLGEDVDINQNIKNSSCPFILPYDSTQEAIIKDVNMGKSMIIKGPPGTGKTLTIANMIATLLANGKRVLFSSRKIAAMTEVYAKLPEKIRNFSLLLEAESEAMTAKINPSLIRKELKRIYDLRCDYQKHNNSRDIDIIKDDITKVILSLNKYFEFMHNDDLVEDSYYDTLLKYYNIENDHKFDVLNLDNVKELNKEEFNYIDTKLKELDNIYKLITHNYNHPVFKSPFYMMRLDSNRDLIYKTFNDVRNDFINILNYFKDIDVSNLSLISLVWFFDYDLDNYDLDDVLNIKNIDKNKLYDLLINHINYKESKYSYTGNDELEYLFDLSIKVKKIEELNDVLISDIKLIYESIDILKNKNLRSIDFKNIADLLNKINDLEIEKGNELLKANKVFNNNLDEKAIKDIINSYNTLEPYQNKTPGFFNFSAKKAFKKLKNYSYLSNVEFNEIVNGVIAHKKAFDISNNIDNFKALIERQIMSKVDDKLLKSLIAINKYDIKFNYFVELIDNNYNLINNLSQMIDGIKINDLYDVINLKLKDIEFNNYIKNITKDLNVINKEFFAKNLFGILELNKNKDLIIKITNIINDNKNNLSKLINSAVTKLKNINNLFDNNRFISDNYNLKFDDIKIFIDEVYDRNILASYDNLLDIYNDDSLNKYINIKNIIDELNQKYTEGYSLYDAILKSLYFDLLNYKISCYKGDKNRIALDAENDLSNLYQYTSKLMDANVLNIEDTLMDYINPNDKIFNGITNERDASNLRLLFKNESKMILGIKKCFILSPSTASLLFRNNDYNDFDVVIVDEASQMLPEMMLPLLYRSKQAIIVGDEWQMPPISHFKIKDNNDFEGNILDKDQSLLALALRSKVFMVNELKCHYRSNTESLIKFSQERFYPNMQTFPSPVPKTEELGITDCYVEDGNCVNGENLSEAKLVIEKIEEHFNKYYDEKENEISKSLGIVAFGAKQLDLILSLFNANKALSKIYKKLESKYSDMIIKHVFFRTIEKVQGQEADCLILSLTYGKNKDGNISQSFAELNKEYGLCIFNVAVTRAKSKIIVIHSILHTDITNSNIDFIKNYLYIADLLGNNYENQFISSKSNSFIENIGSYLEKLGIDKNRIVYNFGVTNGSIRIPIAILSSDLKEALIGIWAEKNISGNKYIDVNSRYYNILKMRGWNFYNIYAHGWFFNNESEKERLKLFLSNNGVI